MMTLDPTRLCVDYTLPDMLDMILASEVVSHTTRDRSQNTGPSPFVLISTI